MNILFFRRYWCVILSAWGLFGIGACAALRPAPDYLPPQAAAELLESLQGRAAHWRAYQAQAAVRIHSPSGNYRLQAFLVARPPDRLRFEATNPGGQTVWVLILNPDGAMFWLPTEGVNYVAKHGDTILNHFAGAPIPADVFAYCFVGAIPPDQIQSSSLRLFRKGDKVLGQARDLRRHWRFTWELLAHPAALQSLDAVAEHAVETDDNPSEQRYRISFEPPVGIQNEDRPQKVLITARRWKLEANMRQLVKLDEVPPHAFDHIAVPGAKVVNLDVR